MRHLAGKGCQVIGKVGLGKELGFLFCISGLPAAPHSDCVLPPLVISRFPLPEFGASAFTSRGPWRCCRLPISTALRVILADTVSVLMLTSHGPAPDLLLLWILSFFLRFFFLSCPTCPLVCLYGLLFRLRLVYLSSPSCLILYVSLRSVRVREWERVCVCVSLSLECVCVWWLV